MDMNLSKLQDIVEDRGAWRVTVHGITKNQTWLGDCFHFPEFLCSSGPYACISLDTGEILLKKVKMLVTQSCPTLCDPMDCNLPGSSVHGILQARILEWIAICSSRGSSWLRDWTQVSCIAGRFFTVWATREALHPAVFHLPLWPFSVLLHSGHNYHFSSCIILHKVYVL